MASERTDRLYEVAAAKRRMQAIVWDSWELGLEALQLGLACYEALLSEIEERLQPSEGSRALAVGAPSGWGP